MSDLLKGVYLPAIPSLTISSLARSENRTLKAKSAFGALPSHSRLAGSYPHQISRFRPNLAARTSVGASPKRPFVSHPAASVQGVKRVLLRLPLSEMLREADQIPVRVLNEELPLAVLNRTCPIPSLPRLFEQRPLRAVERGEDRV